jgi:hypothetical protein
VSTLETIAARVDGYQTALQLPEEVRPTKAILKKVASLGRRLGAAVEEIQHLFWTVKGKLKHRTILADGRLQVVPNEAAGAQAIVQCIERQCTA